MHYISMVSIQFLIWYDIEQVYTSYGKSKTTGTSFFLIFLGRILNEYHIIRMFYNRQNVCENMRL